MARYMGDVAVSDSGELSIADGDWGVEECTGIHARELIVNTKNDFKETPTACVDALSYIDDEGLSGLMRAISEEMMRDGMEVKAVNVDRAGVITAEGFYK